MFLIPGMPLRLRCTGWHEVAFLIQDALSPNMENHAMVGSPTEFEGGR